MADLTAKDGTIKENTPDGNNAVMDMFVSDPNSPLTMMAAADAGGGGDSPLTASSLVQRLQQKGDELAPNKEEVAQKRQAIMDAYNRLIQAQSYQSPDVANLPMASAGIAGLTSPGNSATSMSFGNALQGEVGAKLSEQAKQMAAQQLQAKTALEGASTNASFSAQDLENELKFYQAAATADYKNNLLNTHQVIVKDQQGNPIGSYNKLTGQMQPLNGASAGNGGAITAAGGVPQIPGIAPESPVHAGVSSILTDAGVDPNDIYNRTRADVAQSTKDTTGANDLLRASQSAAQTAQKAKDAINKGYAGGTLGSIESSITSSLPPEMQPESVVNRDLLNKYSGQISSSLATQMKGARIGVGMEKFLKGTTFNPDISQAANLKIVDNLQDLPYVAQRNLDLNNITAKLPEAAKSAIYSQFITDNPPFLDDGKDGQKLNPVYKNKTMVQDWLGKHAGNLSAAPGTEEASTATSKAAAGGVPTPQTQDEYDALPSGATYFNVHFNKLMIKK